MTLLDTSAALSGIGPEATPKFIDAVSRVRFEYHTPFARPDLWLQYLSGALATYRAYGVEEVLEFAEIRSGLSTTLFVVGVSPADQVIAGARFVGPILDPRDAHVSTEFAGSRGEHQVRAALRARIPEGVVEFKGCWVETGHRQDPGLSSAVSRSIVHAMRWLGVRYGCCSAADHAVRRWQGSGGRVMAGLDPIHYPSEKYRTTLLWWDADRIGIDADAEQWRLIQQEQVESATPVGVPLEGLATL